MSDRESLIQSWLERCLGGAEFRLEPASEDASFRRYLRAVTPAGSFIVMDAPPEQENCTPFVDIARRLEAGGLNVPAIHAADVDNGLLLLGDLGSVAYLGVLDDASADALYGDAIDALILMQSRVATGGLPEYDDRRLRDEMALFPEWFLKRHLGLEVSRAVSAQLEACFVRLCDCCREQPQVFVHRDYHSRNLMHTDAAPPGILDFQDAVVGMVTYDLVSLLRDVYIRWPQARVTGWIERYLHQARAAGLVGNASDETFRRWFDLTGVQRHIKVAGIFARLFHRDGKPQYIDDIALTLRYLQEVCEANSELQPMVEILAELDLHALLARANAAIQTHRRRGIVR